MLCDVVCCVLCVVCSLMCVDWFWSLVVGGVLFVMCCVWCVAC